jgi:hypothetical protein
VKKWKSEKVKKWKSEKVKKGEIRKIFHQYPIIYIHMHNKIKTHKFTQFFVKSQIFLANYFPIIFYFNFFHIIFLGETLKKYRHIFIQFHEKQLLAGSFSVSSWRNLKLFQNCFLLFFYLQEMGSLCHNRKINVTLTSSCLIIFFFVTIEWTPK